MPGTYTKNADGSFTEVVKVNPLTPVSSWLTARSGETSTLIGAVTGTALAPTIFDNASKAVVAGLAGDYLGCATYGIPAVVAIYGALVAIIKPDQPKGPTDDQIKAHVAALNHDELIQLLQQADPGIVQPGA